MTIVKWKVSTWLSAPERAEYAKQTKHFYINTNGGRDSIVCRYYSYFDSEADALAFIEETKLKRLHAKNVARIKDHGVELLEVLEEVMKHYPFLGSVIANNANYVIAKAKGEA